MKILGIVLLLTLCGVALSFDQRRDFEDHIGFPNEPDYNDNNNNNRPDRPGRPGRPTTTTPAPTPSNPGVDGAGALIGCNCPSTSESNLVCGTDGNTYGNMGKLKCAQRCGHNVELAFIGNCKTRS